MEILPKFPINPNPNNMIERVKIESAIAIAHSNTVYVKAEAIDIVLLLSLCTNHPEKGNAAKAPSGNMNNTPPNSASFKLNLSLICGICEAQLEKINPKK